MAWHPQWQPPTQWPFWTPWAYHQAQGSFSKGSRLVASEHQPPQPAKDWPMPWGSEATLAQSPPLAQVATEARPIARPGYRHHGYDCHRGTRH